LTINTLQKALDEILKEAVGVTVHKARFAGNLGG
jgi:hypothetical protein